MAFRARKVLGSFEKRTPDLLCFIITSYNQHTYNFSRSQYFLAKYATAIRKISDNGITTKRALLPCDKKDEKTVRYQVPSAGFKLSATENKSERP